MGVSRSHVGHVGGRYLGWICLWFQLIEPGRSCNGTSLGRKKECQKKTHVHSAGKKKDQSFACHKYDAAWLLTKGKPCAQD